MSDGTWELLTTTLAVAVPERIAAVRGWDDERRDARRLEAVSLIAHHGDHLLYRGKRTREVFVAVVDGLALASFAPGGVTFAGQGWCAEHGAFRPAGSHVCPRCVDRDRAGEEG